MASLQCETKKMLKKFETTRTSLHNGTGHTAPAIRRLLHPWCLTGPKLFFFSFQFLFNFHFLLYSWLNPNARQLCSKERGGRTVWVFGDQSETEPEMRENSSTALPDCMNACMCLHFPGWSSQAQLPTTKPLNHLKRGIEGFVFSKIHPGLQIYKQLFKTSLHHVFAQPTKLIVEIRKRFFADAFTPFSPS